mgnify:CR=1 FL=1
MASPGRNIIFLSACLLGIAPLTRAQDASINPNGVLLAQNENVIEQARLRSEPSPSVSVGVDSNGNALAEAEPSSSSDDSMGAQRIMKAQEPVRNFTFSGGRSFVYTDNVALTGSGERMDLVGVEAAGKRWWQQCAKHEIGHLFW